MVQHKSIGTMNPRPGKSLNSGSQSVNKSVVGSSDTKQRGAMPGTVPYESVRRPVSQTQSELKKSDNSIKQGINTASQNHSSDDSISINDFVTIMRSMVGPFALLNDDVIEKNIRMANGEGMNLDDRTMSFECVDYVMSNMAFIFMGLVLDKDFRQAFLDATMVEIQIDDKSDKDKAEIRASMKDNKPYKSNGNIIIGVTTFMPSVAETLMTRMHKGFTALDRFADEFDTEVGKMAKDDKITCGFIFSNFMYLIRAFTHNDIFMSYVITIVEKVKDITKIS